MDFVRIKCRYLVLMNIEHTENIFLMLIIGGGLLILIVHLVMIIRKVSPLFLLPALSAGAFVTTAAVFAHFASFPLQSLNQRNN